MRFGRTSSFGWRPARRKLAPLICCFMAMFGLTGFGVAMPAVVSFLTEHLGEEKSSIVDARSTIQQRRRVADRKTNGVAASSSAFDVDRYRCVSSMSCRPVRVAAHMIGSGILMVC